MIEVTQRFIANSTLFSPPKPDYDSFEIVGLAFLVMGSMILTFIVLVFCLALIVYFSLHQDEWRELWHAQTQDTPQYTRNCWFLL